MYWPLISMELHCFLCVAPKTPATLPSLFALNHAMSLIFETRVWYTSTSLCGSWFNPLLTLPTYPQARTHMWSLSFPQCYFNTTLPPTLPLDTACIDCVPKEGLVFYITYDILLDPPVAPISVSGFCSTTSTLVVALAVEGCWHSSVSVALTLNKPVLSNWPTSYWYTAAVSNSLQQQSSITKIPRNLHLPIYSSWRWWAVLLFYFESLRLLSQYYFVYLCLHLTASFSSPSAY